jgi:hypothetical protein
MASLLKDINFENYDTICEVKNLLQYIKDIPGVWLLTKKPRLDGMNCKKVQSCAEDNRCIVQHGVPMEYIASVKTS